MIRELIMFIAYQTTEELMNPRLRRLGPYGRVKFFVVTAMAFTVVTMLLVIKAFFIQKTIPFSDGFLFLFFLLIALFSLAVSLIFKRSILARAIKKYKGTKMATYGGAIGLGYFLLNMAAVILVLIFGLK